jgi:hypothetical protein
MEFRVQIRIYSPISVDRRSYRLRWFVIPAYAIFALLFFLGGLVLFVKSLSMDTVIAPLLSAIPLAVVTYLWRSLLRHYFRKVPYIAGKSFAQYRRDSRQLSRYYHLMMLVSATVAVWAVIEIIFSGFSSSKIQGLVIGAFSIVGYYRSRSSTHVHGDVDACAVQTIRMAGSLRRERVLAAHRNFDPNEQYSRRDGHVTFAVLADRLVVHQWSDGKWHQSSFKFANLTGIGICDGVLGVQESIVQYLFTFKDGGSCRIRVNSESFTTEGRLFTRALLNTIDEVLLGTAPAARIRPTREVSQQSAVVRTAALPPISERNPALELDGEPASQDSETVIVPARPSRAIEFDFA